MISGVPEHVDGRMIGITEAAGARLINRDRMWHYVEGIRNWNRRSGRATASASCPARPRCGSTPRASACPRRCSPAPTRSGSCTTSCATGYDYSWFILTQSIIKKEFALSGSEQNPDLTGQKLAHDHQARHQQGRTGAGGGVQEERRRFHRARQSRRSRQRDERARPATICCKLDHIKAQIEARDREMTNPYVKDAQVMNIHNARRYIGDRLIRTAKPHRILDPAHGPLIAVKLNILTRKTLGGFETDLDSRVFGNGRRDHPGTLRRRRSGRLRRRRHARLPFAGRHLPRRLPVLGQECRAGGGEGGFLISPVMAGHSRLKDGVASARLCPSMTRFDANNAVAHGA